MRKNTIIQGFFPVLLLLSGLGCEPQGGNIKQLSKSDGVLGKSVSCSDYSPKSIEIMPLTGFVTDKEDATRINVFVSLLDSFSSQLKAPAIFRFELYERVQYSTEPKGQRLKLWPDVDLTNAVDNNKYWRDFLRGYEFNLDFQPTADQSYILQVTCMCQGGRRLTSEFILKAESQ